MNNSDWIVFVQIQYCLALPPVGRDVHLAPGTGPGVNRKKNENFLIFFIIFIDDIRIFNRM